MFTGLIEAVGEVLDTVEAEGFRQLRISRPPGMGDLREGSSIAANGVCITAREIADSSFRAHLSHETLQRTTLGFLESGAHVNLELALRADSRLGGHIVQGHVDGVGQILSFQQQDDDWNLVVGFDPSHASRLVHKGSVAVDGISLTVADLEDDRFSVAIIPYTLENTTLKYSNRGDKVNLEFDVLAKYVERLLEPYIQKIEGPSS
jgi:riboflavin synthase